MDELTALKRGAGVRPQLVKASEIMRMLNISRANFEALIERGWLSPGIELGIHTRRWDLEEVRKLLVARQVPGVRDRANAKNPAGTQHAA